MRVIFVPVADRPECAKALKTAFTLGKQIGASVRGCHIRAHSDSDVALPQDLIGGSAYQDAAWATAWRGEKTVDSSVAARKLFGQIAAEHDFAVARKPGVKPRAYWQEMVGSPDKVVTIMGPVSDLVLVTRPARKGGSLARMFMLAALLNSSRPVLILPDRGQRKVGRKISIAWNQRGEAARAVAAALPLLQGAEQVTILTAGPEDRVGPKATHLATYLRHWGVNTEHVRAGKSEDGKTLLAAHKEAGSDLLVMGAYSRSRLRERIFGGVSDYMINKANIPVLMLHT